MSLIVKEVIADARERFPFLAPEFASSGGVEREKVRLEKIERDEENRVDTFSIPYRENSTLSSYLISYYLIQTKNDPRIEFDRLAKTMVLDGTNGFLVTLKRRAA